MTGALERDTEYAETRSYNRYKTTKVGKNTSNCKKIPKNFIKLLKIIFKMPKIA